MTLITFTNPEDDAGRSWEKSAALTEKDVAEGLDGGHIPNSTNRG